MMYWRGLAIFLIKNDIVYHNGENKFYYSLQDSNLVKHQK